MILIIEDKHKSSYDHATNSYMNEQWVLIYHGPCAAIRTGPADKHTLYANSNHDWPMVWFSAQYHPDYNITIPYYIVY